MLEKEIEHTLMIAIRKCQGLCEKLMSGTVGWPDRIVLLPDGKISFVEVKQKGKKPRPMQLHRHEQLRRLGFKVFVLDDPNQIQGIIDDTMNGRVEKCGTANSADGATSTTEDNNRKEHP